MHSSALLEPSCMQAGSAVGSAGSVTAIIPTFNRPLLVERAIQSVLSQSYRNLDLVLVIDGNDDRTRDLAVAMHEPRMRVVALTANVGAAQARNIGVGLATGKWIAFLDDDDEWLPEKIALQMEAACASHARHPVISSRVVVRTPAFDWISPSLLYTEGQPMSEFLFCRTNFFDGARYMQTSTLLMQRELMLKIPFQANLKRHQDWDWLLRASVQLGVSFNMLSKALAVFNVEDGRTSLGRTLDWEFSLDWAREMRHAFTPRAYSFFLANECVSRAVKSHARGAARARLAWEFFTRGRPTARSLTSLLGFLCIPEHARGHMRRWVRRLRPSPATAPPARMACGQLGDRTMNADFTTRCDLSTLPASLDETRTPAWPAEIPPAQ